jgi:hypothetical protein
VNPRVDQFGKATVSLGGRCPLGCAHCYTTVPTFAHDDKRDVTQALELLSSLGPDVEVICLSGDTDPFLRPKAAVDYLRRAADERPHAQLMFTTRLVPPPRVVQDLHDLGCEMARADRLLVGAVSVVTASYPNTVEDPKLVPSSDLRFGLLRDLSRGPQPVLLALRPTLPFSVVSSGEIEATIEEARDAPDAILGEVLLLDSAGVTAARLRLPAALPDDDVGELSFLNQATIWRKRSLPAETRFVQRCAARVGIPYFVRSMSAMKYFRRYWDLSRGVSRYQIGDALDLSAEGTAP